MVGEVRSMCRWCDELGDIMRSGRASFGSEGYATVERTYRGHSGAQSWRASCAIQEREVCKNSNIDRGVCPSCNTLRSSTSACVATTAYTAGFTCQRAEGVAAHANQVACSKPSDERCAFTRTLLPLKKSNYGGSSVRAYLAFAPHRFWGPSSGKRLYSTTFLLGLASRPHRTQ